MCQFSVSNMEPTQLNIILPTTVVGIFPLFNAWFASTVFPLPFAIQSFLMCFEFCQDIIYLIFLLYWIKFIESCESVYYPSFVFSFLNLFKCYFNCCNFACVNGGFFRQSTSSGDIVNSAIKPTFFPIFFDLSVLASLFFLLPCFLTGFFEDSLFDSSPALEWS